MLVGLLLGVTFAGWALISETRKDMQSDRIERKMHEVWAIQEANTMRTFAKTGVLAPMAPRPQPEQVKK
jgi:serine/threonine-protein kinase RIO1